MRELVKIWFLGIPFSATIDPKRWRGLGLVDLHLFRLLLRLMTVDFVEEVSVELVKVLGLRWSNMGFVGFAGPPMLKGLAFGIVEVV